MKKALIVLFVILVLFGIGGCGSRRVYAPLEKPSEETEAETITVENVTGLPLPEAQQILGEVGFTNITDDSNRDEEWDPERWIVASQSISAGVEAEASDEIFLSCIKLCHFYIDISSRDNILFDRYDMSIEIDDTNIGTVPNGATITYLADVYEGEHVVTAYNAENHSVYATYNIEIDRDLTFSASLEHGSAISFNAAEITDGVIGASLEVPNVTGAVLNEAMAALEQIGFINIRQEPYDDIWDRSNWLVVQQGVAAGEVVDKNTYIQLDCIRLDEYFNNTYSGKTINEIQQLASEAGFNISLQDPSGNSVDLSSLSEEEKNTITAIRARNDGVEDRTAIVTIPDPNSVEVQGTITVDNNEEFAALFQVQDPSDPAIAAFAASHHNSYVEFDGVIGLVQNHEDYDTRFDVLIFGGSYEDPKFVWFYFENLNFGEMNVSGSGEVRSGLDFHIIGKVIGYNDEAMSIEIEPVSMVAR